MKIFKTNLDVTIISSNMKAIVLCECVVLLCFFIPGGYNNLSRAENVEFEAIASPTSQEIYLDGKVDVFHSQLYPKNLPKYIPEVKLRIENIGMTTIINPRVYFKGRPSWRNIGEFWNATTGISKTDVEKALSLYWFIVRHTIHGYPTFKEREPIRFFNSYGLGPCDYQSALLKKIAAFPGWSFRNSWAADHSVGEVRVEGRFLHLDTDTQAYYLDRNNEFPIDSHALRDDPYLVKRTVHYGYGYDIPIYQKEGIHQYSNPDKIASLYHYWKPNREPVIDKKTYSVINLNLRPGESFEYRYEIAKRLQKPQEIEKLKNLLINGVLETVVTPENTSFAQVFSKGSNLAKVEKDGRFYLTLRDVSKPAIVRIEFEGPWPVAGFEFRPLLERCENTQITVRLKSGTKSTPQDVLKTDFLRERIFVRLSKHLILLGYPVYSFTLEIVIMQSDISSPLLLKELQMKTYFQITRYSVPQLALGDNTLIYKDDNFRSRRARIYMEWKPCFDSAPPRPPETLLEPRDGEIVPTSRVQFRWPPATDPDGDSIDDYQFELSAYQDMRYPLSPNFDRLLSRTLYVGKSEYELPIDGLLSQGKMYYWHVRAVDKKGFVSNWTPTGSFQITAPNAPIELTYEEDDDEIWLKWKASPKGSKPVRYEVHGSNEFGFFPSLEPRKVIGLGESKKAVEVHGDLYLAGAPTVPPTLVELTKKTKYRVVTPKASKPNQNLACYRVIAIDKKGSRSAPSEFVSLPPGYICSPGTATYKRGNKFVYQVKCIRPLGKITAKKTYFMGLWTKPVFRFMAEGLPEGLIMNTKTGLISGTPELDPKQKKFDFTVAVQTKKAFFEFKQSVISQELVDGKHLSKKNVQVKVQ